MTFEGGSVQVVLEGRRQLHKPLALVWLDQPAQQQQQQQNAL
jgi:hypothetical protein